MGIKPAKLQVPSCKLAFKKYFMKSFAPLRIMGTGPMPGVHPIKRVVQNFTKTVKRLAKIKGLS